MTSACKIRPYDHSLHRDAVIHLWDIVFGYDAPHNKPSLVLDKKLAMHDDLLFLAFIEDKLIGTVMGGYDGHRGWLYSVAVNPVHRKCGVGAMLVKHAEQSLVDLGCVKINLQIVESNSAVAGFYESLGYAVEKRISMGKRIVGSH